MKKSILVAQSGMYYILKSGTFKEWTNTYQDTVSYDEIKQKVITQANDYHRMKAYTP